ncbi:MAG: DUF421 domain-containing protein [Actinomycetota bacterium]
MNELFNVNWERLFIPDTPILEIFIRGSVVYFAIFFLLRFVLQRQAGVVGITDLLVVVLIADAAQNAMADDYHSISDGILLVATLIFWSYTLDWLGYKFPRCQRLLHPQPLPLIKNGRLLRKNMRRELITENELMSQLREQGVEELSAVKIAYMEGDGYISIIKHQENEQQRKERRAN